MIFPPFFLGNFARFAVPRDIFAQTLDGFCILRRWKTDENCLVSHFSKDVRLPVQLQRAMAAEAEAAREARAKVRSVPPDYEIFFCATKERERKMGGSLDLTPIFIMSLPSSSLAYKNLEERGSCPTRDDKWVSAP